MNSEIASEKSIFYSKKTWKEVGVDEAMINSLKALRIEKPSKIQALSYRQIYEGKHAIISDQTGSGKTLSYLIPSLQRLLDESKDQGKVKPKHPQILIIAPTTELASQVSKVVRKLGNVLKIRSACFTSFTDLAEERLRLRLGAEVLVSTPGRLLALIEKKDVILDDLKVAILDEADILFMDESFPLQPIGESCPESTQFLFATATLPPSVQQQIQAEFPEAILLSGPGMHRIAPTIEEEVIDCSGARTQQRSSAQVLENKRVALSRALQEVESDRTLIFCNTIEQCRKVENMLQRDDRNNRRRTVLPYHGALEADKREENLALFSRKLLGRPAVLVCTDRASRGMDFDTASVDHVILFDFPRDPSEYLRRVGRTGRAGRRGKATVLVYGKQVEVAKTVVSASIQGKKIEPE